MGITRIFVCLFAILSACATGCGSTQSAAVKLTAETVTQTSTPLLINAQQDRLELLPDEPPVTHETALELDNPKDQAVKVSQNAVVTSSPITKTTKPDIAEVQQATQDSPFFMFGNDVLAWDNQALPVVRKVPASHRALETLRQQLGHQDGTIEDTASSRLWLQECIRYHLSVAVEPSDALKGFLAAQGLYSCLGGLAHLTELVARYWWSDAGLACIANSVMHHSLHADDAARPLAICASRGYDPARVHTSGWLKLQCLELVANNPNAAYPQAMADASSNSVEVNASLPSCWEPLLEIIQAHAQENLELDLPDSPHACFHAFLGYVWARQVGLDTRPPDHLAVGCDYRAFEAQP